jgi:hypothetical protein
MATLKSAVAPRGAPTLERQSSAEHRERQDELHSEAMTNSGGSSTNTRRAGCGAKRQEAERIKRANNRGPVPIQVERERSTERYGTREHAHAQGDPERGTIGSHANDSIAVTVSTGERRPLAVIATKAPRTKRKRVAEKTADDAVTPLASSR